MVDLGGLQEPWKATKTARRPIGEYKTEISAANHCVTQSIFLAIFGAKFYTVFVRKGMIEPQNGQHLSGSNIPEKHTQGDWSHKYFLTEICLLSCILWCHCISTHTSDLLIFLWWSGRNMQPPSLLLEFFDNSQLP